MARIGWRSRTEVVHSVRVGARCLAAARWSLPFASERSAV